MFQLLPCSICQRTFSLRQEVREDALLKCPNCGNQFRLGEVLDAFYSPWIVLDSAPTSAQPDALALASPTPTESPISVPEESKLSFDNLLHTHNDPLDSENALLRSNAITDDATEINTDNVFDTDGLELIDTIQEADNSPLADDNSPLSIEQLDTANQLQDAPYEATPVTSAAPKKPRIRKGDKGGIWSIVQVILGGAAAIPVTVLLLWYVVGKDIMNAGPTVAQYAPWIVPKKFHNAPEYIRQRPDSPRVPPPALGEGGFRNFDEELGTKLPEPGMETAGANASNAAISTDSATADDNKPDSKTEDTGMKRAFEIVRGAKQKIADYDPKSPERSGQVSTLFNDLVELAELLSAASSESGALRLLKDDLKAIGRSIAENKELRTDFGLLVAGQFAGQSLPTGPGRIFLGLTGEVGEADDRWIVTPWVADKKAKVERQPKFEVTKQSVPQLQANQRFFCLGTVSSEEKPEAEGSAPTIVHISATFLQTF